MFSYQKSARESGRRILLSGAVLLCLGLGALVAFWWTVIIPLVMFFVALAGALMIFEGVVRLRKGGDWDIRYDGNQLSWQAPAFAEDSFTLRTDQIERIFAHVSTRTSRRKPRKIVFYTLQTRNGTQHRLVAQSGVDVAAIVALLQQQGVPLEEVWAD